ncbi:UDP-N-acetylmuramoyl-L-alanine--D-glutamate ligase [Acidiphilium sp. PA]|uniref:UDP-N-acetylmuramoyl-L-alanine--D-glutamate ligase n=1 Tax=Acidiphilium sp. PA TaxID=2871705 RepID=UPI002243ADFA|nr:UDP-N-acetylmuramoyl-L-alanine--D-glutamate ligase [Acidiphilium sp. PA]MCW8305733.1 UDP-N-acetylmuramoyl-L-alanine--D-glutamate ligase [Acidiphilium sp. PA]
MSAPITPWPRVFEGQRFAVLGLGQNGLPAAVTLRIMGAAVVAWDDDAARRDAAAAAGVPLARPSETDRLDALILSPGIPHDRPAPHPEAAAMRGRGVPILSDAELLFRAVRAAGSAARFAGITGTNGKSTTTALLAHTLAAAGVPVAAGGNLGPASLALPLLPDDGVYVLEMSSYMLERIATMRFDAAIMLNLTHDHLDRHGSMAGYIAAKAAIFARQTDADTAVIGIDDEPSRTLAGDIAARPARLIRISGNRHADFFAEHRILRDGFGPIADLSTAPALRGTHNAQNAAAAAAVALALGIERGRIGPAFASFAGLPHRQQRVATIADVDFIDDSKATNADAAARALDSFDRVVWIAGGIGKDGGIAGLAPWFDRIDHAVLIGRDAPIFAATLAAHGVSHEIAGTLDRAVPLAFDRAHRRGIAAVLLAPAAASFDQFANYAERGLRFAALARSVPLPAACS